VERNEEARAEFRRIVDKIPSETVYYIDESGIDKFLYREYGYAIRGRPVEGKISGKKYKRTNIVAAKCRNDIVAPVIYEGTMDHVVFECWLENVLLPSIPKHSTLVMDNASFHNKKKLRELVVKAECEVLFLPPYSPDLNPIEMFWAWLKKKLRSVLPQFDSLWDALVDCFHAN